MDENLVLNSKRFWNNASKHILGWSIFITYEITYIYLMTGVADLNNYALNYTLNIILFYFNAHVLFNYSTRKFKRAAFITILLVMAEIALFVMIKYPVNNLVLGDEFMPKSVEEFKKSIFSNAMRTFYILGFSTAYWFALQTNKRNRRISELENQRLIEQNEKITLQKNLLQSRNAYLQAQVNPHLLFNTLNFMYNTSVKVSEKLAETVMNLSDMMRYALTSIDEDDKVPLEKEIEHIHNYLRLNQSRFNNKLCVDFIVKGSPENLRIIPLALITLVENVFQYGDLQDPQNPALISITIHDGGLELELKNKKRTNRRSHGHGTGIRNLRERLDIYYPGIYTLEIQDEENSYALKLTLTLNE